VRVSGVVPFVDLQAQYRSIENEIREAVERVFESGQFVLGPEVEAFEQAFAALCRTSHAVAVNSGTSALHLALLAAGVGPGDEVITVPMTFVATVAAIVYTGAKPVFVDVDPATYTLDVGQLEAAISPRTKAVVPVHLYGQSADMDAILAVARRHGLAVIEDAAQAHGATYNGRAVGSLGDLACFSFYPAKNLGACGEGGIVVTSDLQKAVLVRTLRDWGQDGKYNHVRLGFNYRMDALQGAILGVKLKHLAEWTEQRRSHACGYRASLQGCGLELPAEAVGRGHVYHLFVVRTQHREELQAHLAERGVQCAVHYPVPVHLQPAFAHLGLRAGSFPVAERCAQTVLSLPLFPEMTRDQRERVSEAVGEISIENRLAK